MEQSEGGGTDDMPDLIPLAAFCGADMQVNTGTRGLVLEADVIVGVDVVTGQEYVVYGKAALKRIADTGQAEDLGILRVGIDASADELDRLCGLVMFLRGRFDYGQDWENR
jgi:hypothetical protein